MTRDDERMQRAQQGVLVGGLADVPGIVAAMRLTPAMGVHLRALADELLVNDYAGATISRFDREAIATAVSAANDCFFCMDSHAEHGAALLSGEEFDAGLALLDEVKSGSFAGFDPKMQALLNISRTVGRNALELTAADIEAAKSAGATRCGRSARGGHRGRLLDVQPAGRRPPRPDRTCDRSLSRDRGSRSPPTATAAGRLRS